MPADMPFCAQCGARNEADANFCESCGASLIDTATRPPAQPAPPPLPPAPHPAGPPPARAAAPPPVRGSQAVATGTEPPAAARAASVPATPPRATTPGAPPMPPSAAPAARVPSHPSRRWAIVLAVVIVLVGVTGFGLPGFATLSRDRAEAAAAKGQWDAALATTDWMVRLGVGRSARLYAVRGRAFAGLGRHGEAFASYHEAGLRLTPAAEAKLLDMQGRRLEQSGFFATALLYYGECVRLDPKEPDWLVDRARAYARSGDPAHAAADFRAALQIDPQNADARAGVQSLASSPASPNEPPPTAIGPYGGTGGTPGGETVRPGVPGAEDPQMLEAYLRTADSLSAGADWTAAEAVYRSAVAADPANARAQAGLAGALLRLGRSQEAAAAAREALRLGAPRGQWVFRELGM